MDLSLSCGDKTYRYRLLSRLQQDCDYYFGCGNHAKKILWAGSEEEQIQSMKTLWNSFDDGEKPEWLSWEDIQAYEAKFIATNKCAEPEDIQPVDHQLRQRQQ